MKAFPNIAKIHMLDGNSLIKEEITSGGMDLRDYFAAKAMQSLIINRVLTTETISNEAYRQADFMMKAREVK